MFGTKGRLVVTFCFLMFALMLVFQSHHLSDADMNTKDGYTCNTEAQGSLARSGKQYTWEVWADYFAKIYASGRQVGDSADGRIEVSAFLDGGTNPPDINENFTLRVRGWKFIKWGEVYMEHHYSTNQQSSPTLPVACASSGGHFGTVTAMTETYGNSCP